MEITRLLFLFYKRTFYIGRTRNRNLHLTSAMQPKRPAGIIKKKGGIGGGRGKAPSGLRDRNDVLEKGVMEGGKEDKKIIKYYDL